MSDEPTPRANWWRRGSLIAAVLLVLGGSGYGIYRLAAGATSPQKHNTEVVTLKLIQPPPPPPPPPPPVQKPPEPAKMIEQPKDTAPPVKPKTAENKPQQASPQKGDSNAKGTGDGTGPMVGGSDNGGQYQTRWGWYANLVQESIQQVLQKDDKLRSGRYAIVVAMTLSPTGKPDRVKLIKSTGNPEIDARIEQVLSDMPRLSEAPPTDMPQPVNLRIDASATQ